MKNTNYLSVFLLAGLMILATNCDAQIPESDPRFEVRFSAVEAVETDEFIITFSEMHCQTEFALVKIDIENKTDDWLFFDPNVVTFTANGATYTASGREWDIDPKKSKSRTVKVSGEANYKSDSYTVKLDGAIRLLPTTGTVVDPGVFSLPASTNSLATDNFKVTLVEEKRKTKESIIVFECTYTGNDIGLVLSNEPSMCPAGDNEKMFSTDNMKDKTKILEPGKKTKVKMEYHIPASVADMQFAALEIYWNGTLVETEFEDLDFSHSLELTRDDALTIEKNK
jgi:hypothetical protein